ncbi:hypothetical protein ABB37_03975 [Leptomonas pyrrhocoris]|uniref:Uncharacterized protein n=1 Tax=Leptomonas pyrrhocoris TaxID=157538 RepID=A0A0M9G402_LEPPY|nr:hypothetical protein ABB37_03975 [Leptomonas pyrrhocoris]XP_015660096.1 hypothetical protein ABB37_03975 [Leptomonas pyrrhocoris]KPA81656.1 hypothetical protein ABB37_03975 [Leptomonas pyrrhocoris]KPA81657.1 hypothetical protein ABB37_03975 [Leptomonas pyrrhocoris]|eukprot:XP_015660095.1 hypothetical protein ABB37_03975 [Leptomonas pyrrhocoris]
MRYNVAVTALLKRIEQNRNVLTKELSQSLSRSLATSVIAQCYNFSLNWKNEVAGSRAADRGRAQLCEADPLRAFPHSRWRNLVDHIPTLLLCLQFTYDSTALVNRISRSRDKLLTALLYNIPRRNCSLQVYALYRALLMHLLPSDLRNATSAHLFCTFVTLAVIRSIHKESVRYAESTAYRYVSDGTSTMRQNRDVAEVVDHLPDWLKVHFTIQDDAPLLRRLCDEFLRRLPPAGESFSMDYVKTLVEGELRSNEVVADTTLAYAFSRVIATSSVHRVSREEFVLFLPKLVTTEVREERTRSLELSSEMNQFSQQPSHVKRRYFYAEAGAVAVTNALSNLCLLRHVEEVMAARPLNLNEWLCLMAAATGERQWADVAQPALFKALRMAEKQRLQRLEDSKGRSTAKDTLFPLLSDKQWMWLLRHAIGNIAYMRYDPDALCRVVNVYMPVLSEYGRVLHRDPDMTVAHLFELHNILPAFWILTRLFGVLDDRNRWWRRKHWNDVERHDEDTDDATPSTVTPRIPKELKEEDVLKMAMTITDAVEKCLTRSGDLTRTTISPPAPPLQTDASAPVAPTRGSGFARTAHPPPRTQTHRRPRCGHTASRESHHAETRRGAAYLLLETQFSCLNVIMENRETSPDRLRYAVATTLRLLPISNTLFETLLQNIKRELQELTDQKLLSDDHTVQSRYADTSIRLPPRLLQFLDIFTHQKLHVLRAIRNLSRSTCESALSVEERATVVLHFTDVVNSVTSFLLVLKDMRNVNFRAENLVHNVSKCYAIIVMPAVEKDNAYHGFLENRQAVQRLSCVCLETVNHIWSSSFSAFTTSGRRDMPAVGARVVHQEAQVDTVRLAFKAMGLGGLCGLTSEELPHLVPTLHRMFDTLTECSKQRRDSSSDYSAKVVPRGNQILCLCCSSLYRLCSLGVYDEGCFAAATEALRRCGEEENIKMMSTYERNRCLMDAVHSFRILSQRSTTSRDVRQLMQQLLVVSARMAAGRLAFAEMVKPDRGHDTSDAEVCALSGQAVLMWQLASMAVVSTTPSPVVDKSINALMQFVKRHLGIPVCAGYTPPLEASTTATQLDYHEQALRTTQLKAYTMVMLSPPRTPLEVAQVSNTIIRNIVSSNKRTYRRVLAEMGSGATAAHRQRWQTHMDVFSTLVQRFKGLIAPTLWHRIVRECLVVHDVLTVVKLFTPLMQDTLVLAIDQLLLYSEAHDNTGTWGDDGIGEAGGEAGGLGRVYPVLYEAAKTQLIVYHRAARLLAFHEHIKNMHRRVYLVELMDRLAQEAAELERRNEVPLFTKSFSAATTDGQHEAMTSVVQSGRSYVLSAFRKMHV